ncbi:unnamed protein product [Arctogadus glacialis]
MYISIHPVDTQKSWEMIDELLICETGDPRRKCGIEPAVERTCLRPNAPPRLLKDSGKPEFLPRYVSRHLPDRTPPPPLGRLTGGTGHRGGITAPGSGH